MKILMLHNRYLYRGGEDECTQAEVALLRAHGCEVDLVEQSNERVQDLGVLRTAMRTVWCDETYREVARRLRSGKHDLLHVQNFFPLISPAAHYAAAAAGVPVVQTLHNYRLVCPGTYLFRNGKVCEDCVGKAVAWPAVLRGCYRDSRGATFAVATMLAVHRLLGTWQERVDVLVALTPFARQKYIEGGLPAERIVIKPNFVDPDPGIGAGTGDFALFVGRLSPEKGLDTLLAAWRILDGRLPLKIVGDGPLADQVAAQAAIPGVEYLGRRSLDEVYALMGQAQALIFPSNWPETFGRVAIEAFAKGTPVITTNLGAMATLVDHGRTGLHYEPGNATDLARQVTWLIDHPTRGRQMRVAARTEFEAHYTGASNYRALMEIYHRALETRRERRLVAAP